MAAINFHHLVILSLIIIIVSFNESLAVAKIILPLIHRDSTFSPFYRSVHHHQHPADYIDVPLTSFERSMFMVNISIGDPPVPTLLLMDGGSHFIWVCIKGEGCDDVKYDNFQSSSYHGVSCTSDIECKQFSGGDRCEVPDCTYRVFYADESTSGGKLATETFTLPTSLGGTFQVKDVIFGIAKKSKTKWNGPRIGIFGLLPLRRDSLIFHLGLIYSFCLGNISDPSYMYSNLILGAGANIGAGDFSISTPLKYIEDQGHFLVDFRGIAVDGRDIEIDQKEFGYNTLIDSGAVYTWLRSGVYDPLRSNIEALFMARFIEAIDSVKGSLCYGGNLVRDLTWFPVVELNFAKGAIMYLGAEMLFKQESVFHFCLALNRVEEPDGINILGAYAQQGKVFGFDFITGEVHFEVVDCLEES